MSYLMPPIKVTEHLPPIAVNHPKPGLHVFDFGQNAAGWARLTVTGPRGARIRLRYAEDVHPDGSLDSDQQRARRGDRHLRAERRRHRGAMSRGSPSMDFATWS